MPMTVKVMGKQALACFPSLVSPRKHDFNGLSRRDCLTAIASLPVSLHWQPFNFDSWIVLYALFAQFRPCAASRSKMFRFCQVAP
jgi:hypothetical protein